MNLKYNLGATALALIAMYLPPYFSNGTTMGSLKAFQHSPCRM